MSEEFLTEDDLLRLMGDATASADWAAAAEHAEALVRLKPNLARSHYNLGVVLLRSRQWEGALRAFSRALEIEPGDEKASVGLRTARRALEAATDDGPSEPLPKIEAETSNGRARRRLSMRTVARLASLTALALCSFLLGGRFERWGGWDRLMPIIINTAREKALGDKVTLDLERFSYSIQDSLRRGWKGRGTPDGGTRESASVAALSVSETTSTISATSILGPPSHQDSSAAGVDSVVGPPVPPAIAPRLDGSSDKTASAYQGRLASAGSANFVTAGIPGFPVASLWSRLTLPPLAPGSPCVPRQDSACATTSTSSAASVERKERSADGTELDEEVEWEEL